jgi:hypothetical protein
MLMPTFSRARLSPTTIGFKHAFTMKNECLDRIVSFLVKVGWGENNVFPDEKLSSPI